MTKSKKNIVRHKKFNRYNRITKKHGGNRFTRRIRDLFRRKKSQKRYNQDQQLASTPYYRLDLNTSPPKTRRKFNLPSWLRIPKFLSRKKREQYNVNTSPIRISDYPGLSQPVGIKPTIVGGPDLNLESPSNFDDGPVIGLNSSPGITQTREEYERALKRGEDILQTSRLPDPSSLSNIKSPTRMDLEKRALATGFVIPDQINFISDQDLKDVIWGQEKASKLSYDNMMKYIKSNPTGTFEKYIMDTEDAANYLNNRTEPLEKIYNLALSDYFTNNPKETTNKARKNQLAISKADVANNLLSVFDSPASVSSQPGSPTYDSEGGSRRRNHRTRRTSIRKNKKYKKIK